MISSETCKGKMSENDYLRMKYSNFCHTYLMLSILLSEKLFCAQKEQSFWFTLVIAFVMKISFEILTREKTGFLMNSFLDSKKKSCLICCIWYSVKYCYEGLQV